MAILLILGLIIILLFCGVIAFGAPFLPTLSVRVDDALELLDLKPGQTMLELGCGDGRLLVAAAKQGVHSVGYELNPLLYAYARLRTWRQRDLITVKLGDYWRVDWPEADGIYVFLLQPYMSKLHKRIIRIYKTKHIKVVSFAFKIEEKKPAKEISGMFLYKY